MPFPSARVTLFATLAVALACAGASTAPATAVAGTSGPCGLRATPAAITHVVVIMDENHSYSQLIGPRGSATASSAPYLNGLARACGIAADYHVVTHGSHPDYMAITSGQASRRGITSTPSIFAQLQQAGRSWRVYAQSMPSPCYRHDLGGKSYKTGHNAALWYADTQATCSLYDVPMGANWNRVVWANALRSYSYIVPDNCHDMHSCAYQITRGDRFLRQTVSQIASTADYRAGHTVIFITWDEGSETPGSSVTEDCLAPAKLADQSCHVPLIVVSASTRPGTVSTAFLDHYSVLRASEDLLHLGYLPSAATAPGGLTAAFNL